MTSINFVAVICDADEPGTVNTAYEPESSLTMSPRSTSFVLLILWFEFRILEVTDVHQCGKVDLNFSPFCASRKTSFLLFTLFNCPLCPLLLSHPEFFFHRLEHRNKLVQQIVVTFRIEPCHRDMILTIFFGREDPRRFLVDSCASTMHACFVFWKLLDSLVSSSVSRNF